MLDAHPPERLLGCTRGGWHWLERWVVAGLVGQESVLLLGKHLIVSSS
jgi:hypothetical protein